ncbi:GAF and ANTAR domain-containing protein [Streptomyces fulvoviolaceus]|uniref:GAF and ANTAR domain-containing protein n=1 Tax=Streptomyces fulvoviolaceus TaxID=285535 RepID=UPI0021BED487|nr:GAF and ANTAR domain-containing protein [Streptomyces fulvoviolaceus]MCT9081342.1 GAF and ANTAR domain-containing protein [Streptomyces fulvoviolaceus]
MRQVAATVAAAAPREMPARLCESFHRALGADGVTVSLLPHTERWQLLHATTEFALHGEEGQFTLGDGPTVAASAGGRTVLVPDVQGDVWQLTAPLAERLPGVRTVLALPLGRREVQLGVITVYFGRPHALAHEQVEYAQHAADLAVVPFLRAQEAVLAEGDGIGPAPVEPWTTVHQAVGMLAARLDCPVHDALDLLRARSFARSQSLPEVAADLLNGREDPADDVDPDGRVQA